MPPADGSSRLRIISACASTDSEVVMDGVRTSEPPALIRADEAAALLGVSSRVLYEWCARGVLPADSVLRSGRSLYFRRTRVLEWAGVRVNGQEPPATGAG